MVPNDSAQFVDELIGTKDNLIRLVDGFRTGDSVRIDETGYGRFQFSKLLFSEGLPSFRGYHMGTFKLVGEIRKYMAGVNGREFVCHAPSYHSYNG